MWAMIFPIKAKSALPQYLIYPSTYRPYSQLQLGGCALSVINTDRGKLCPSSHPGSHDEVNVASWVWSCNSAEPTLSSHPQNAPPLSRNLQRSDGAIEDPLFFCCPAPPSAVTAPPVPKPAVHEFNHLQTSSWPSFPACQPKSVLWHHLTIQIDLFQCFQPRLRKTGPAALHRSTSRKTFPLSTREMMTCLCNTFLKTFFQTGVMSPRLLCWLSKQSLFFPDCTICNPKSTFPHLISPVQDLEMISGKHTNETLFSRERHSGNNLMGFIFISLMHI